MGEIRTKVNSSQLSARQRSGKLTTPLGGHAECLRLHFVSPLLRRWILNVHWSWFFPVSRETLECSCAFDVSASYFFQHVFCMWARIYINMCLFRDSTPPVTELASELEWHPNSKIRCMTAWIFYAWLPFKMYLYYYLGVFPGPVLPWHIYVRVSYSPYSQRVSPWSSSQGTWSKEASREDRPLSHNLYLLYITWLYLSQLIFSTALVWLLCYIWRNRVNFLMIFDEPSVLL